MFGPTMHMGKSKKWYQQKSSRRQEHKWQYAYSYIHNPVSEKESFRLENAY